MAIPTYEIYALKYGGPYTRPGCMINWFQDMDRTTQINYYIFAIRGGGETIVVKEPFDIVRIALRYARPQ